MTSTTRVIRLWVTATALLVTLSACNDGSGSASTSAATSGVNSTSAGTSSATGVISIATTSPTITGNPPLSVEAGATYLFTPSTTYAAGVAPVFSITNKPVWAVFNPLTGSLSGTPTTASEGPSALIGITLTVGAVSATLPGFSIDVLKPGTSIAHTGPLTISGEAATTVKVGSFYNFVPTAADAAGKNVTFSIADKPSWATFDPASGKLSGTPGAANLGTAAHIVISVSDGTYSASLPAFSIAVAPAPLDSVTVSWTVPKTNADGSPIENLAGYKVYYGAAAGAMTSVVTVANPADTQQVVGNLAQGTWYFAVTSYTTQNVESALSPVVPIKL